MVRLEDITKDAQIRGLHGDEVVKVVSVDKVGDLAISAVNQKSAGGSGDQMLFRSDEYRLELAQAGKVWAFDAPGSEFKLALEARCIQLAHLFDPMMAVHTKNEIFSSYHQGEKYFLAMVLVNGEQVSGPYYIKHPFKSEPDFGIASVNCDLSEMLSRAIKPEESL